MTTPPPLCPFCRTVITAPETMVTCARCAIAHHAGCWADNGGCACHSCGHTEAHDLAGHLVGVPPPPLAPPPPRLRLPPLVRWVDHLRVGMGLLCGVAGAYLGHHGGWVGMGLGALIGALIGSRLGGVLLYTLLLLLPAGLGYGLGVLLGHAEVAQFLGGVGFALGLVGGWWWGWRELR